MAGGNYGHNEVRKAALIIAVFSVIAKILGFVRAGIFANKFAIGDVMDAYVAAFRLPDFIFSLLIMGTFSVAFIPVFSDYLVKDKKRAYELASSILNLTLVGIAILSIFGYLFVENLVSVIAPGLTGETRELTISFTKIFLLSPIFMTLSSILSSILQAEKKFLLVSLAPVFYNLSIIFGAVYLYPKMGVSGLAWGVVLGAFLHLVIQLPGIWRVGFNYSLALTYQDPAFKKFWKLYWPRIFSMGTNQATLLIVTFFGSFLGTGALSSFYYADTLQSVFLSVFAVSFAMAVFPLISEMYNKNDINGFRNTIAKTTNQILFFIIPLSTIMLVERAQIVRLIFGFGEGTNFDFNATRLVALNLGLFVISLFAQALIPLYNRAFYARHNTITPMIIGFITIAINILVTYFSVTKFGVPGMVLAFSVTSILQLILLMMELHRKIGTLNDEYLMTNTLKIVIASMIAGIFSYVTLYLVAPVVDMQTYLGILIQGTTSGIIGVVTYIISASLLKVDESDHIIGLIKSAINKSTKPFAVIWDMWN